jgi:hypothetical protein
MVLAKQLRDRAMHCRVLAFTLTNQVDIASFQTFADKLNHDE